MRRGILLIVGVVTAYFAIITLLFFRGIPSTEQYAILVGADLPIGIILLLAQRALETPEKPEHILKHYGEINDRIFKKWAAQCNCETRQFFYDWGRGGFGNQSYNLMEQAAIPIFYQPYPPPKEEDYEWFQRAMRHLKARRYHKLLDLIHKMENEAYRWNMDKDQWLHKIRTGISTIMTKYPLRSEGEFYSEADIESAILAWGSVEIKDDKIVYTSQAIKAFKSGAIGGVIARIADSTIRNLVLGEIRLLIAQNSARTVGGSMPYLLKERNKFLEMIIHEIEGSRHLDGNCDVEDPSHPLDKESPKW